MFSRYLPLGSLHLSMRAIVGFSFSTQLRRLAVACSLVGLVFWILTPTTTVTPSCRNCQDQFKSLTPSEPKKEISSTKSDGVLQRTLAGGESFSHQFALKSGEYLHFTVEQQGINISLILLGSHGEVLRRLDNNRFMYGSERLSLIVNKSGMYSLRVTALPHSVAFGSYELRVDQHRLSRPEDKLRVVAEQQLTTAISYRESGQRQQALAALLRAEMLWSEAQDTLEQLNILNNLGDLSIDYGEIENAIKYCNRALNLSGSVNSPFEEALILNNLGDAFFDMGQIKQALDYYEQALPLRRQAGDLQGEAVTIGRIGASKNYLGNLQSAVDSFQQALAISRKIHDDQGEARILFNLGMVYETLGETERALDLWTLAIRYWRDRNDQRMELYGLLKMGRLHLLQGHTERALEIFAQSLSESRALSDYRSQAFSLFNLAEIYARSGKRTIAFRHYGDALTISRRIGDPKSEAQILCAVSSLYEAAGEYGRATSALNTALHLSRSMADRRSEANALYLLAQLKRGQGDLDGSLKDIETALRITDSVSYKIDDQSLRASYFASVRQYYELCIDVLMQLDRLRPQNNLAAYALQVSERLRARTLLDLITNAGISASGVDPNLIEQERSLRQLLSAKTAYQLSVLGHTLERKETGEIAKDIENLTLEYQQVQSKIRQKNPRYEFLTQSQPPRLEQIQSELQGTDTLLLEYALGTERSYLWVVSANSVSSYELPAGAVIEGAAREVYALLTARQSLNLHNQVKVEESDKQYWEKASSLAQMLLGPIAGQLGTKRLVIVSDGMLHYIPFEGLPAPTTWHIRAEARPLIVDHEIVHLPSASVLVSLRQRNAGREHATKAVAVFADPVFEVDDPRVSRINDADSRLTLGPVESASTQTTSRKADNLNGQGSFAIEQLSIPRLFTAGQEAEAILRLAPRNQELAAIGFQATRQLAMSNELSQYKIVHFATHGLINSENPELSGIMLSMINEHGQRENGFLQLHDIYNLKLSANLVVLSACSSGLGKNFKGEGLLGLTQGFMYSGAQSVVASLWNVDDRATADLMTLFYKGMIEDDLGPAAALRKAQIEMWQQKRWQAPYYWAGFTLQGDWNGDVVVQSWDANPKLTTCGIVLFSLVVGLSVYRAHKRFIRQAKRASH